METKENEVMGQKDRIVRKPAGLGHQDEHHQEQLKEYRTAQRELITRESIGNKHIDMGRDPLILGRTEPEQTDDPAGKCAAANRPDAPHRQSGDTKASQAAARAIMDHENHRYTLNTITQRYGNLSYVAFSQSTQRAVVKVQNDTIQGFSTGTYYLRGAAGAAGILLSSKPTAAISRSAHQITPQDMKGREWMQQLRHRQMLDQKILKDLTVGHKISTKSKNLQELSRSILKNREDHIYHKFGKQSEIPASQIPRRIQQLKDEGRELKKHLQLLEGKKILTMQERSEIMRLRDQLRGGGRRIGALYGLKQEQEDLDYIRRRLSGVVKKAGKQRQRIISTAFLVRNLALQPSRIGVESNTEWLAKGVSFTTNPRTIRYTKKVGGGTARTVSKVFRKVAPTADNWVRYQVSQQKKAVRKTMKSMKRGVRKAIPSSAKKAAHTAAAPIRGAQKIGTGIYNRAYMAKKWMVNTRPGVWLLHKKEQIRAAGGALKAAFAAVKPFLIKGMVIFGAFYLIVMMIAAVASMLAGGISSTVIMSPETDGTGKINLSPYVQIVRSEITAFNSSVDNLRKRYEDDPAYDKVDVLFSGTSNNMREILSMMAVRMQQDLDLGVNREIEPYLKYLVELSHSYSTSEHHYFCSGCKLRPYIPPGSHVDGEGNKDPVMVPYCPGHTDVTIHVMISSLDDMMQMDQYAADDAQWLGWNEENTLWCEGIFETDWAELYTGMGIGHGITVGTVISPEHEKQIWDSLRRITGNSFGAAGLMGNLYAESGLVSTNLENGYEDALGYDDASYTHAVDSGTYDNFTGDWAGYGLAQWTDPTRKNRLLQFAKSKGVSIGDLDMQLGYLQEELSGTAILLALQTARSVQEASDEVLVNFERPVDQSDGVKRTRASFGEYFYNKYELGVESEGHLTQKQMDVIRVATNSELYGVPAEKGMCQAWAALVYGAAGLEVDGSCCAYHSGMAYGVSDDWSAVPPGAAVYGYAGNQYGHVGIYVGNGLVYHNIGGVAVDTLEDWIRIYDGFVWGWQAGQDLTIP